MDWWQIRAVERGGVGSQLPVLRVTCRRLLAILDQARRHFATALIEHTRIEGIVTLRRRDAIENRRLYHRWVYAHELERHAGAIRSGEEHDFLVAERPKDVTRVLDGRERSKGGEY